MHPVNFCVKRHTFLLGSSLQLHTIGGGFEYTMELKPMKYKEAIHGPDGKAWEKEVENDMNTW